MKAIIAKGNVVGLHITKSDFTRRLVLVALGLVILLHQIGLTQMVDRSPVFSPQLGESLPLIQADQVHKLGITGEGVGVAIIDIFTPNPNDPCRSAHGAWIEGIISGVAPDAHLVQFDIRTVPSNIPNTCYLMSNNDINVALRQILAKHQDLGIQVVNLSWGGGQYASPCQMRRSETSDLLRRLVDAGITVIAAAGNEGFDDALIWPACLPDVISVGASFDYSSERRERTSICSQKPVVDQITCYSNTASYLDLIAPGSRATISTQLSGLGTSASTAYASGVAALLLQADDTLSPRDVRRTLSETGKPIVDPRNGLTFPRIDALSAVRSALPKTPQASQPGTLKGDVNQDEEIDSKDILELLSALGGLLELDEEQTYAADVARPCDGVPNLTDLSVLKNMALRQGTPQCQAAQSETQSLAVSNHVRLSLQSANAVMTAAGVQFNVRGLNIEQVQVSVFDLSGKRIFDSGMTSATSLNWPLLTNQGQRVPNGVYLYVVRVRGNGEERIGNIQKLAVIR